MFELLLALGTAFISTWLATPVIIYAAKKLRLLDDPATRNHPAHVHEGIIPRAGGIALLIGFIGTATIFIPSHQAVLTLITASCLTVFIGVLDDRWDLSPYFRFGMNILTALIVVSGGVTLPFITNPLGGIIPLNSIFVTISFLGNTYTLPLLANLAAVLWIVWTMNIVGWSSGVDGQMPGFVAITAIVLGLLSFRFSTHDVSQQVVAAVAFITAGAYLGFLPWNFYPQKIMPGYGGKTLAGLLLATIAILSGGKVGSLLLLLAIPMIDAVYALVRRIIAKKSPFRADRAHLHHRLLDIGWSKPKIALFYWIITFILGVFALSFNSRQKVFVFIMMILIVSGILYWIRMMIAESQGKLKL